MLILVIIVWFVIDDDGYILDGEKLSSGGVLTKYQNVVPKRNILESKGIIKLSASSSFFKENSIP